MTNKFVSSMELIGHDIKIAWQDVIKYLPAATSLAGLLFPGKVATLSGVVNSIGLIQQAVVTVEQKFAAAGAATGTGAQKLSHVSAMVGPTVLQLLSAEGLNYDQARVQALINAIVAILNVSEAPAS